MIKKLVFTFLALNFSLQASEMVWDGSDSSINSQEYDKAIQEYIDKTYPQKVKEWKKLYKVRLARIKAEAERKRLYKLNHPTDKYGNEYGTVKSSYTGKIWLDRNLGASRVCTSYNDSSCYGDYFQWGRDADGHEKKESSQTSSISYSSTPNHSKSITSSKSNRYDWISNQNDNLWQGINGKNNPCPKGFRVPTIDELLAETTKQGVRNKNDAFNNFLKLPSAGKRTNRSGSFYDQGSWGDLWSSSVNGKYSHNLYFNSDNARKYYDYRATAFSVRCTKD